MSASTAHRTGEQVWRQTGGTPHKASGAHTPSQRQQLTRFAILPAVPGDARAVELVHEVLARAAVLAHDALAFVDVCKHSATDRRAGVASDRRNYAHAERRAHTHTQRKLLTRFAIFPAVPGDARAVELVHEILARAAVLAHDALAFVDVCKHSAPDRRAGVASDRRNYAHAERRTHTQLAPATHSFRNSPRCTRRRTRS